MKNTYIHMYKYKHEIRNMRHFIMYNNSIQWRVCWITLIFNKNNTIIVISAHPSLYTPPSPTSYVRVLYDKLYKFDNADEIPNETELYIILLYVFPLEGCTVHKTHLIGATRNSSGRIYIHIIMVYFTAESTDIRS